MFFNKIIKRQTDYDGRNTGNYDFKPHNHFIGFYIAFQCALCLFLILERP